LLQKALPVVIAALKAEWMMRQQDRQGKALLINCICCGLCAPSLEAMHRRLDRLLGNKIGKARRC